MKFIFNLMNYIHIYKNWKHLIVNHDYHKAHLANIIEGIQQIAQMILMNNDGW